MTSATNLFSLNKLDIKGKHFVDPNSGRVVHFRGVNLGGGSKLPVGWTTSDKETTYDLENLTFVGKPLKLEDAEEHCRRLKYWGLTFIRLCVTWESFEHKGPGVYDEDYIEYLINLLTIFKKYGIRCFIDPHQDAWSRLCGGSGAPNWTLYMAGFDPRNFSQTGAAVSQFDHEPPEEFPVMTWLSNYTKLATATMFTLFYGGATFAPKCNITLKDGTRENIQDFLQRTFCEAYQYLFRRLKEADLLDDVVIGIDTLNEPSEGFIGFDKISSMSSFSLTSVRNGACPTPLQAMILGEGNKCKVDKYGLGTFGFTKKGTMTVNPKGVKAWFIEGESSRPVLEFPPWSDWQTSGQCIWACNGIWDRNTKKAIKESHFSIDPVTKKKYNFLVDFWKPFVRKISKAIRAVHEDAIIFIEPPVSVKPPTFSSREGDITDRIVYAPHWYDNKTLVSLNFSWWTFDFLGVIRKKYWFIGQGCKFGKKNIRKCFREMIGLISEEGLEAFGEVPCLIGETGIPYNLDDKKAYTTGDYTNQVKAMDASFSASEREGALYTLWNYVADNTHAAGDLWNREDFSIFCNETQLDTSPDKCSLYLTPLDKGGRALEAVVRPYAMFTPGVPIVQSFMIPQTSSSKAPSFQYTFRAFSSEVLLASTTDKLVFKCEIFLPPHHFPPRQPLNVTVSEGTWEVIQCPLDPSHSTREEVEPMLQTLVWSFDHPLKPNELHSIQITYGGEDFSPKSLISQD